MDALPTDLPPSGTDGFTGLVCPDCRGALTVQNHKNHVGFTCRVGHSYSADELIGGKEAALETRLWEAVYAFEEMAVLVSDLEPHELFEEADFAAFRRRAAQARDHAGRLRAIVQADRPLGAPASPGHTGAIGPMEAP